MKITTYKVSMTMLFAFAFLLYASLETGQPAMVSVFNATSMMIFGALAIIEFKENRDV